VIDPPLFAVADGMGGAQAGEVASKLAAGAVKEHGADVESLIQEANRRVHQRSLEDPNTSGMGTTLTVAAVEDGVVSIGHVGDSRAYLVRDGNLEQLTEDHSLVGELLRTGKLSPEEAESHPQRSMITRALGTDPNVDVDIFAVEPRVGDLFLLCSDGLTSMVDDRQILRLVGEKRGDLQDLVKALIKAANKGGGDDNITVVAFEIGDEGATTPELEDTAVVAVPAAHEPNDEDTLTEADRVPTVDTAIVSVDEIAAAYEQEQAPPPRRRRRFLTRALSFLIVIALLFGVAYLILWGLAA
jgi:PPM family protein phosphatase